MIRIGCIHYKLRRNRSSLHVFPSPIVSRRRREGGRGRPPHPCGAIFVALGVHALAVMAGDPRRAPRLHHDRSRPGTIDHPARRILSHDRMDVRRSQSYSFLLSRLLSPQSHSDAVSFSAIFVWCAFQTGNSLQVHRLFLSIFLRVPSRPR